MRNPRVALNAIELIRRISRANLLWGAERIPGELLKLGVNVSKRTIQKYAKKSRGPSPKGQNWETFLKNHTHDIWACDFLQVYDLLFRPIFLFFIIDHGSRRVVHAAATRSPTEGWVAQQLREATPFGEGPKYIIRDNDGKFGQRRIGQFDRVAKGIDIEGLHTPPKSPLCNSFCEWFLDADRSRTRQTQEARAVTGIKWPFPSCWVRPGPISVGAGEGCGPFSVTDSRSSHDTGPGRGLGRACM